jgi:glycosyltransferase involved in cell wall biosynthesis
MSCEQQNETSSTPKVAWVINPFDQLPNETDLPLRYWTLCRVLAEQGHEVIWWSSDFSHLSKTKRHPCPHTDGFAVRLIETPPYTKNISLARLRNHKAFGAGFYKNAITALKDGSLKAPDRMVVSLPPLGIAEQACKIRDYVNQSFPNNRSSNCQVVVDIMDAWPETFYRALPKWIPKQLKNGLLYPMHFSANQAYTKADKISAVGQTYLNLANQYLPENSTTLTHLCYHGTDLSRFQNIKQEATTPESVSKELQVVCLGSMNEGYDLSTVVQAVRKCKECGNISIHLHFAGTGSQEPELIKYCQEHQLLSRPVVVTFHGQLNKQSVNELLLNADLGLVTNKPETLVACPYKAAEYAAAGLPILSCLGGELGQLLRKYNAGSEYKEGDVEALHAAFEKYLSELGRLNRQASNARIMAEDLFDRNVTYLALADFISL